MPAVTYLPDSAYDIENIPNVAAIKEWLLEAKKIIGTRICIEERSFTSRKTLWAKKKNIWLYAAFVDTGNGEAQIVNFAPRTGSNGTINHYVPAEEIAAWLMGIVTGGIYLTSNRNPDTSTVKENGNVNYY